MSLNDGHAPRNRTKMRGYTPFGKLVWTDAEDDVVRDLFPDYKAIERVLPYRTYYAVKRRAADIGIPPRTHVWTTTEVSRLRKMYPTASHSELMEAFPGIALKNIKGKATHIGLRRKPKEFQPTGHPLLDEIRSRCFELNLSMVDLDAMARTGKFFQNHLWKSNLNYSRIAAGVHAIGGTLKADWGEED